MNFMALMLGAAVFLNSVYCTDAAKMPPEAWYKVYVELATGSGSSARHNSSPWLDCGYQQLPLELGPSCLPSEGTPCLQNLRH